MSAAVICSIGLLLAQSLSVSAAWVPVPAAGETSAAVYLSIANPTMYDVYVMSATTDAAESVELREPDGVGGTRAASSLTATAYGSLEMAEAGPHLRLRNLTQPLKAGDTVTIVLATNGGERLTASAIVK